MVKRALIPHPDNPLWMLVPLGGKHRGTFAVVDVGDAEEVGRHNWSARPFPRTTYAQANIKKADGSAATLKLHRLIAQLAGFGDAQEVDHRNGDGLDCRRSNLRPATRFENGRNLRVPLTNTSGFKGVSWDRSRGKWVAQIKVNQRRHYLGSFDAAESAAHAYDAAAIRYFGPFAALNFPIEPSNDNNGADVSAVN